MQTRLFSPPYSTITCGNAKTHLVRNSSETFCVSITSCLEHTMQQKQHKKTQKAKHLFAIAQIKLQAFASNNASVSNPFIKTTAAKRRKLQSSRITMELRNRQAKLSLRTQQWDLKKKFRNNRCWNLLQQSTSPWGLISPFTLPGKIILQSLWKQTKNWDDPLDQTKANQVNSLPKRRKDEYSWSPEA